MKYPTKWQDRKTFRYRKLGPGIIEQEPKKEEKKHENESEISPFELGT